MAKRFTDSDKWRKPWFRSLPTSARMTWVYLTDNCDHAGVWPAAFDLMTGDLGFEVTRDQLRDWFGSKILRLNDDKYFLPGFIEFQYGELSRSSNPHNSVIKILEKNGIDPISLTFFEQYPKGIGTLMDKDKDQAKDKDKDRDKINTSQDLRDAIPLITREQWARKYPDPSWMLDQIESAFEWHSSDPAAKPSTDGQWMKKLTTWLANSWEKRQEKLKKISVSAECGFSDV